jgi:hypothetical protein
MRDRLGLNSDRVLRVRGGAPAGPHNRRFRRTLGLAAVLPALAVGCAVWAGSRESERPRGERKERSTGDTFATQTDLQSHPGPSQTAAGRDSERVWSGQHAP